jgi:excisionase family DNA binding protein
MDNDRAISANGLARQLGVSQSKIVAWIRSGELTAHNLAADPTGVPRWRILPADLADFLAGRRAQPAPAPRSRRRRAATSQVEYY